MGRKIRPRFVVVVIVVVIVEVAVVVVIVVVFIADVVVVVFVIAVRQKISRRSEGKKVFTQKNFCDTLNLDFDVASYRMH